MPDRQYFVDNAWRWKCGLPELESGEPMKNLDSLYESQWCNRFDELRHNRMVLGTYRYGDYKAKDAPKYDRIGSAISRLKRYQESGNAEYLVDVANLCMIEFDVPNHPNAHFESIDDGEHAKRL